MGPAHVRTGLAVQRVRDEQHHAQLGHRRAHVAHADGQRGAEERAHGAVLHVVAAAHPTVARARQDFAEHFHTFRVGAQTLTDPQLRRSDLSAFELEISSLSETSAIL